MSWQLAINLWFNYLNNVFADLFGLQNSNKINIKVELSQTYKISSYSKLVRFWISDYFDQQYEDYWEIFFYIGLYRIFWYVVECVCT